MSKQGKAISEAVVRRLPVYLQVLGELHVRDVQTVSSQELGLKLELNPAQIRKDLAYFGEFGRKGVGYDVNYLIEKIAYKPLRNAPRLAPLITAMGMSLLLQTLAMIIWQPSTKPYPILLPNDPFFIGGAVINLTQILILVTTAVVLFALMYLVNRTKLGRAMRATAENPRVAALMGVRPDHVISATFIIGAALAALAGVMYAANYGTVQHTMGFLPGLKAFTAAVFGGIGNLAGAVVGGVLLGIIEALGSGYIGALTGGVLGSQYSDIFAFLVLILVLTVRPQGLMGERVADRA